MDTHEGSLMDACAKEEKQDFVLKKVYVWGVVHTGVSSKYLEDRK